MKIEISGFDPDAIMRRIEHDIEDRVRDAVRGLRCPEHGASPAVRRKSPSSTDELNWAVEGCCPALIKAATENIGRCFK